jgi:hypothetical protein
VSISPIPLEVVEAAEALAKLLRECWQTGTTPCADEIGALLETITNGLGA